MEFKEILKNNSVIKALDEMGYSKGTKIQEAVIPTILEGKDVLGQSQTGTGKTLAFCLPILENIKSKAGIQALILAPTRELGIQIERDIEEVAKYADFRITCVYGSSSIQEQIKTIKRGTDIVVGTPGRVKDLIKRKVITLDSIKYFVLDEADEMLSMGFQDELEFIFDSIHDDKQVMLFSATMPKAILSIAKKYMSSNYKNISVVSEEKTAKNIVQEYYLVNSRTRIESLCRLLDFYNPNRGIIFCKTKRGADDLLQNLLTRGYNANVIHGDIMQEQRIATLDKFKSGMFNLLIATDVAARGIHVDDIDVVVNYGLPESSEAYVHRIGRTGRVDKAGLAITIVNKNDEGMIRQIEKHINKHILKKDMPSKDVISERTISVILDKINKVKMDTNVFEDYLNTLNSDTIKELANKLLIDKLNDTLGSNFNVDVNAKSTSKNKKEKRTALGSTRLFVTIGKMDNIEKRDFLSFLEKKASVKEGTFTGMEILTKFTFVNVNDKYLDKVLSACNNIKYKGRTIKMEVANK